MSSNAPLINEHAPKAPSAPRSSARVIWTHTLSLWTFITRLANRAAAPDVVSETAGCARSRPFSGHTFAEAGLSSWVPPAIHAGLRAGFALGLMALTMSIALTSDFSTGARVLLTTAFWGPLIQSIAYLLLSACSMRMQLAASLPDSAGFARLPDIAVPLHQTGSAIALFSPVASIALRSPLACILGAVPQIFFLVDTIMLDAQVRFRLQYILLPFVFFVPGAIINIVREFGYNARFGSVVVLLIVIFALALLQIVCGVVVTMLTRIIEVAQAGGAAITAPCEAAESVKEE